MTNFEKFKQYLAELTAPTLGDKLSNITKEEVNAILAALDNVAYYNEMNLQKWAEDAPWEEKFPE